jgi:putative isomerase
MEFFWKSIPIKVRFAGCFLPMMAGISDQEQNEIMIQRHYLDDKFLSPYGLRSTASDEKMYCLDGTSNPSNNLGPIWILHNYIPFKGLLNSGRKDLATDLCYRLVGVMANDIEKTGKVCECYSPDTGEPIMAYSFLSWNCLIIKMLKEIR